MTDTREAQKSAETAVDRPRVCEVLVAVIAPGGVPQVVDTCSAPAQFTALNMCCGDVTYVCAEHKRMAQSSGVDRILCKRCHSDTTLMWSNLT